MHLHHLQGFLYFNFAKVIKTIRVTNSIKISRLKCLRNQFNLLIFTEFVTLMVFITLTKLKEKTPWRWRSCIKQCRSTYDIHKIVFFLVQCPHHMSLWTSWSSLLGMAAVHPTSEVGTPMWRSYVVRMMWVVI